MISGYCHAVNEVCIFFGILYIVEWLYSIPEKHRAGN